VAPRARFGLIPKVQCWRHPPASLMYGLHRPATSTFLTKPIVGVPEGRIISGGKDDNSGATVEVNDPSHHLPAHAMPAISQPGHGSQRETAPVRRDWRPRALTRDHRFAIR
jgi:hypothetical protein